MLTPLCDMDGVLTDFAGAVKTLFGMDDVLIDKPTIEECLGVSEADIEETVNQAGYSFWADMPETPFCDALIDVISVFNPNFIILSDPRSDKYRYSAGGKVAWLKQKFGKNFRRFMLGTDKHLLSKPGTVLIDDFDVNIDKFLSVPLHGNAIMVPAPWNNRSHLDPVTTVRNWLSIYS